MAKKFAAAPMKPPSGFEAGETMYKVTAETHYWQKPKALPKSMKAVKSEKPPPMEVKVVNKPAVKISRKT